jgi:hypothetical protein
MRALAQPASELPGQQQARAALARQLSLVAEGRAAGADGIAADVPMDIARSPGPSLAASSIAKARRYRRRGLPCFGNGPQMHQMLLVPMCSAVPYSACERCTHAAETEGQDGPLELHGGIARAAGQARGARAQACS